MAHTGLTPYGARQCQLAVLRRGQLPGPCNGLSARTLTAVGRQTSIPRLTLVDKAVSTEDSFAKYLFQGADAAQFETVRIPLMHRPQDPKYVVCVSCQVGCALGCAFCATGRLGPGRNLAAWEIVDQVVQVQADSAAPVRGVVFMGMGEPMLNYDRVISAAQILSEPCGLAIAGKAITISTAGVVPAIRRFTAQRQRYRLVVSLNAAEANQRRQLMPIEKTYPLAELMDALRAYHRVMRRRVILAWTMISGVNTRDEDARRLAELTRGLPIQLDLIDVNDPTGRFQPPSPAELSRFRDALTARLAMPVARRYSGGRDIHAACGMLAGR
ncbi:MAG: radical SAM protein [Thermoguttaceae bacterium]